MQAMVKLSLSFPPSLRYIWIIDRSRTESSTTLSLAHATKNNPIYKCIP
jgi:hypothetical protein